VIELFVAGLSLPRALAPHSRSRTEMSTRGARPAGCPSAGGKRPQPWPPTRRAAWRRHVRDHARPLQSLPSRRACPWWISSLYGMPRFRSPYCRNIRAGSPSAARRFTDAPSLFGDHIRDIERPHDLEALEHGEEGSHRRSRTLHASLGERNTGEGHRATTLACGPPSRVPSKHLIDLGRRLNRCLGGSPDEPWIAFAI
jgi:hypothetical protein